MKSRRRFQPVAVDGLESRALLAVGAAGHVQALVSSTTTSSNQAFVNQLFTVVLGRDPGTTELSGITARLDSGKLTRYELSLGVLNSKENLKNLVNQQYRNVFGAAPTEQQLTAGIHFLASKHGSLNALTTHLYGTSEYRKSQSITNNTEFVNMVASDSGVTLTSAQTTHLVNALKSGEESSTEVASTIINSYESLHNQIDSLYSDYLNTTPTAAELKSTFALVGRGKRWGVRLSLIFSPTFVP